MDAFEQLLPARPDSFNASKGQKLLLRIFSGGFIALSLAILSLLLYLLYSTAIWSSSSLNRPEDNGIITPKSFQTFQDQAYKDYLKSLDSSSSVPALGPKTALLPACKVAIVSTFPPTKCGIAQFSEDMLAAMRETNVVPECSVSVIALHESSLGGLVRTSWGLYNTSHVDYVIDLEDSSPSKAILEAARFINEKKYTHLFLQSEFGITPNMWQQVDLFRWTSRSVKKYAILHTPRAYPSEEERALVRQLDAFGDRLVIMCNYAKYSLLSSYGISPEKITVLPHGIRKLYVDHRPHRSSSENSLLKPGSARLVLMSDGLIHNKKGYLRMIKALPELKKAFPQVLFLIVGKEHPKSARGRLMQSYLQTARDLGVLENINWVDKYYETAELLSYYSLSDVYVSLYDEVTPISGTLISAMAAGMPIIATPYRYAAEMLSGNAGLVLKSFDDSSELLARLKELLSSLEYRRSLGSNARSKVSGWTWKSVASEYWRLVLEPESPPLLSIPDPFSSLVSSNNASWTGSSINDFKGNMIDLSRIPRPPFKCKSYKGCSKSIYSIFADSDLQVNGMIMSDGRLAVVGIRTPFCRILAIENQVIDFECLADPSGTSQCENFRSSGSEARLLLSRHRAVEISTLSTRVSIKISNADRFASSRGLLGDSLRKLYDTSFTLAPICDKRSFDWTRFLSKDDNIFSVQFSDQTWSHNGLEQNLYKIPELQDLSPYSFSYKKEWVGMIESRYKPLELVTFEYPLISTEHAASALFIRMEGPVFDFQGFATVNRGLFLQLARFPGLYRIQLIPSDLSASSPPELDTVLKWMLWGAVQNPWAHPDSLFSPLHSPSSYPGWLQFLFPILSTAKDVQPDFVWRNSWFAKGPDFSPPSSNLTFWVHSQPWEFWGIPKDWIGPISQMDRLVVPSKFCIDSYKDNGIALDKLSLFPHGISRAKIASVPVSTATHPVFKNHFIYSPAFKFLFSGGLLKRKGVDIAVKAFLRSFKRSDNVLLIIHSVYGDGYYLSEILDAQKRWSLASENPSLVARDPPAFDIPQIILLRDPLPWNSLIALFRQCDLFVAPYRAEGFGLIILETMAAGLPAAVTKGGPAVEFTTSNTSYYIDLEKTNEGISPCSDYPCSSKGNKVFGMDTCIPPTYLSPDLDSLCGIMKDAYGNRDKVREKRDQGLLLARQHDWSVVFRHFEKMLQTLLKRSKRPARSSKAAPGKTIPSLLDIFRKWRWVE